VFRISVIIPTRDASGPVRACLHALVPSFPQDAETIVVSDGGPTDPTVALRDFVAPLRLRCLQVTRGGPAYARNRGLAIAQGKIAVFTDDDCRPRAGWLEALAAGVSLAAPRAAGGTTYNGMAGNPYADAAQVVLDLVARHERATCGEVRFFPANNCAFPADILRQLGGFDESFRTAEDRDLLRRWRAAGYGVAHAEAALVDHEANPDLLGYLRKFFGYGRGAAHFHRTDVGRSVGDSTNFHLRLARLLVPEVRVRGPLRGARLVGLLALWEVANLVGMASESARRALRRSASNGRHR
jgi:glycosyltransferase involved in cell wall biosynthesis